VVDEVEKKLGTSGDGSQQRSGQWSSLPSQQSSADQQEEQEQEQQEPLHHLDTHNHKLANIKRHPSHPSGATHSANHLLQQQHHRTMALQQQQAKESKPCVYSITVDYGSGDESDSDASPLPDVTQPYSWVGAMGMLFWSPAETDLNSSKVVKFGPYEGSPIGLSLFPSLSARFHITHISDRILWLPHAPDHQ
jgi:hypothetical protein